MMTSSDFIAAVVYIKAKAQAKSLVVMVKAQEERGLVDADTAKDARGWPKHHVIAGMFDAS